ncbi:MAG: hypothetical protein WCH29_12070, partial [Chitinophagaceae bacterium]
MQITRLVSQNLFSFLFIIDAIKKLRHCTGAIVRKINLSAFYTSVNRGKINLSAFYTSVNRGKINLSAFYTSVNRGKINLSAFYTSVNRGKI